MRWADVCAVPPKIVGEQGRSDWVDRGYLVFPGLIPADVLDPLRHALDAIIESSRTLTESTHLIDLDDGHTAEAPRLRRAANIDDAAPVYWDLCRTSVIVDIAEDILGPNLRFREAYVNLKWAGGGAEVKWHQDLAFYPHTNTSTCQFVVMLDEVTEEKGPVTFVPGTNNGPMYTHYADDGTWVGAIDADSLPDGLLDDVETVTGPAGSVTVHHGLTLHYSAPNRSDTSRPALIVTFAAADSIPYTASPYRSSHHGELVRGVEPGVAHHEDLTLILPPDWSQGYTSLFDHQQHQENT